MHFNRFLTRSVPLAAAFLVTALVVTPPARAQETPQQRLVRMRREASERRRQELLKRLPLVPFNKNWGIPAHPAGKPHPSTQIVSPEEADALLYAIKQRDQMAPAPFGGNGGSGGGGRATGAGFSNIAAINPINTANRWIATGPNQMDVPYTSAMGVNPIAGRVNGIAWDPTRPNVLYMATARGGLWRATIDYSLIGPQNFKPGTAPVTDFGVQPLSDYTFPILRTSSVAIHPRTSRIVYVGTGDFDGSSGTGTDGGAAGIGVGIMKTVNDGRTWTKIADRDAAGGLIFEGTSVSSIVIIPENPNQVLACSGRGTTPGNLWRSLDQGNTWLKAGLIGGGNLPNGDWSKIDYSSRRVDQTRSRSYYASRINDGVYRSDDAGATWQRLNNLPLVFNGAGAPSLNLRVAASKLATAPDVVYVMDASGNLGDGRIFKSTDRGVTWVGITGDYPYISSLGNEASTGFPNNWYASLSNANLVTGIIPVNLLDANGDQIGTNSVAREGLFGLSRALSGAGGIGVKVGNSIYGAGSDLGVGVVRNFTGPYTWTQVSIDAFFLDWGTHIDQHAVAQSPDNISNGLARFGVANAGGVYLLEYLFSAVDPNQFYDLPTDWLWNYDIDVNSALTVQPLLSADFFLRDDGEMRGIAGGDNIGAPKFNQTLAPDQKIVKWNTVPYAPSPIPNYWRYTPRAAPCSPFQVFPDWTDMTNGPGFPPAMDETAVLAGNYGVAGMFAESDGSGDTQYVYVDNGGTGNWPYRRIIRTTDNWDTGLDITPDRYMALDVGDPEGPGEFSILLDKNNAGPNYFFNKVQPKDTTTPTNWQGSTKPAYGQKVAMGESFGGGLYFGTNRLWRYDPPGVLHGLGNLLGPTGAMSICGTEPNRDRGVWRPVGTQTFGGYVTAIAPSPTDLRILYVGTSTGEIWFTFGAYNRDATIPLQNYVAGWQRVGATNLPALPITSISINPAVFGSGDITVSLGGAAGGAGRVWRNANTRTNSFFTPQFGQGSASLPIVPVNALVRDLDDPFNTFFVATDLGVFVTVDGGSTWTNATAPLGLPNAKCVSLKIVQNQTVVAADDQKMLVVATSGRGVWRYNLKDLVEQVEKPNLVTTSTINRVGNQLIVSVTIKNLGGPAFNVRVTTGQIVAAGQTFNSTSIPVGGAINIGTLGKNQPYTFTLLFPGGPPLYPFTSATLNIAGKYTEPPIPPGIDRDFSNAPGYRTRLP